MRKALIVGINHYASAGTLFGCVNDACSVKDLLERHGDGSINFRDPRLMTAVDPGTSVSRSRLKDAVEELFADNSEVALFYFAGHGHVELSGGYLLTSESTRRDEGLAFGEIMRAVNRSKARNKIVILDSCHSGALGASEISDDSSLLTEGVTILTASSATQRASEQDGSGVFTQLLIDALQGAAANLIGDISPGSVYAHIDQSLGAWAQRPLFKTNIREFVSLRTVKAPIERVFLQKLSELFPYPGFEYKLDPSFEPERPARRKNLPPPCHANVEIFKTLQALCRVNLVVPIGVPHMWHAAMESRSCKLTPLGEHYRRLAKERLI